MIPSNIANTKVPKRKTMLRTRAVPAAESGLMAPTPGTRRSRPYVKYLISTGGAGRRAYVKYLISSGGAGRRAWAVRVMFM